MTTVSSIVSEDEFSALTKSARYTPSPYGDDVAALVPGVARKITIPTDKSGRYVVNNLNKAAKEAGVKLQVILREKATPPVVLFRLAATPEVVSPETDVPA